MTLFAIKFNSPGVQYCSMEVHLIVLFVLGCLRAVAGFYFRLAQLVCVNWVRPQPTMSGAGTAGTDSSLGKCRRFNDMRSDGKYTKLDPSNNTTRPNPTPVTHTHYVKFVIQL